MTTTMIFMIIAGGLFGFKILYVLCTALVLRSTRGALYVSTSRKRISAFLEAVPMKAGQLLIDLGCGDGRVLRRARKRYDVRTIGYELNPMAYLKARLMSIYSRRVDIRWRNFFKADLSDADIIFCYLFPDVMKDLADKLKSDLKTGAVVVSCNFVLPDSIPECVLRPGNSLHNDPIYIYRMTDDK